MRAASRVSARCSSSRPSRMKNAIKTSAVLCVSSIIRSVTRSSPRGSSNSASRRSTKSTGSAHWSLLTDQAPPMLEPCEMSPGGELIGDEGGCVVRFALHQCAQIRHVHQCVNAKIVDGLGRAAATDVQQAVLIELLLALVVAAVVTHVRATEIPRAVK